MTSLLTGLDLDRRIAELKGWRKLRLSLDGQTALGLSPQSSGDPIEVLPPYHKTPTLALELLEEIPKFDELGNDTVTITCDINEEDKTSIEWDMCYWSWQPNHVIHTRHKDFCTAVGNAWIKWKKTQNL